MNHYWFLTIIIDQPDSTSHVIINQITQHNYHQPNLNHWFMHHESHQIRLRQAAPGHEPSPQLVAQEMSVPSSWLRSEDLWHWRCSAPRLLPSTWVEAHGLQVERGPVGSTLVRLGGHRMTSQRGDLWNPMMVKFQGFLSRVFTPQGGSTMMVTTVAFAKNHAGLDHQMWRID